jgi:DNA polymerase I-like protein with 3'-5' exonuclease and polymerase domains
MSHDDPITVTAWAESLLTKLEQTDGTVEHDLQTLRHQVADLNAEETCVGTEPKERKFEVIRSRQDLEQVAKAVAAADVVVLDLKTTSTNHRDGEIVGVGLAITDRAFYMPIAHRDPETNQLRVDQLPLSVVANDLNLGGLSLVAHNAKFELQWLRTHANVNCTFVSDTMLAARLLRSDKPAGLKEVAMRVLDVADWSLPKADMTQLAVMPVDTVARYCCLDCRMTLRLYEEQLTCLA